MSFIEGAGRALAPHLAAGSLVVLESTTYPGTTEQVLQPLLEASGLRAGEDFLLAYSPERIDPGNPKYGLRNTPRVVGGLGERGDRGGHGLLRADRRRGGARCRARAPPSSRSCSRTPSAW